MKKYFAKYLRVEGEITDAGVAYKSKKYPHLEAKFSTSPWNKKVMDFYEIEKVKLFLCSRDIQVGDKVFEVYSDDGTLSSPYEWTLDIHENNSKYIEEGNVVFKVIGEIYPEVTFVKEGDEFSDDEVGFIYYPGEDMDTEVLSIDERNKHKSKKYINEITIKCKHCGKYVI